VSDPRLISVTDFPPGVRFQLHDAPCQGCKTVQTVMGSLCEACRVAERERERVDNVKRGTLSLRKRLVDCPAVGTPEFLSRVSSPKLRSFAERYSFERGSVLAIGPSGIGKTTAVNGLLRRLADVAIAGGDDKCPILSELTITGPRIARALRETRLGVTCELVDDARRARLLFLDEIGQEMADPRWLLELAQDRYEAGLTTITTSGLTRAELETRYGSGAIRRLFEPVGVLVDCFGGPA
jgi:DNA replication protein DnaC